MSESLVKTGLFWSYCHSDNDAENGLILDLASNIKKEYRLISGEKLDITTDKEALADTECQITVKPLIGEDAAQTLVEFFKQGSFDMALMGSRGLHGARGYIGSVSRKVLLNASCPILIVR